MSEEIQKAPSFADRLTDRVRKEIGELLTTEELRAMVDKTIEKIMFEKRFKEYKEYGSTRQKEYPPLIEEVVEKELDTVMRAAVKEWIKDNEKTITETVQNLVNDGAGTTFIKAMNNIFHYEMLDFQSSMESRIRNTINV